MQKLDKTNIVSSVEKFVSELPEESKNKKGFINLSPENVQLYFQAYREQFGNGNAPLTELREVQPNIKMINADEGLKGTDIITFSEL